LYREERHRLIIETAREAGHVESAPLAELLNVSLETVRRDLTVLERRGLLKRTHGGAIPIHRLPFDARLAERSEMMVEEKKRIAKAALAHIPEEGSMLLDGGTTTAMLATLLPSELSLTVVTNSLPIATILSTNPRLTVVSPGGTLRNRSKCYVGRWALQNLLEIRVDVAFIGTNGLTVERGLSTADEREAQIKRAMIQAAREVIVLTDHTKIGVDDFCRFGNIEEIDLLITDSGLNGDLKSELEAYVDEIVIA